jgi:hypothetical protein
MSYSVHAYLTDAKKVMSVFGSKSQSVLNELSAALREELDSLDSYFADDVNPQKNAAEALKDIVNGEIRFHDIPYMYGYVYEKICEYYGKDIYSDENLWELDRQNAFIPIPFSSDFPHIISVEKEKLKYKKRQYLALEEGNGIGDSDYEEEISDLTFIFDEAIEQAMDLAICVY